MTILVYDNGKIIVDKADPIEGQSLDNLIACLANPQDGDTLIYNATAQMWETGKGSSEGNVLVLTADYDTGTLNKTWQEIFDAIGEGKIPVLGYADDHDAFVTIFGNAAHVNGAYGLWTIGSNPAVDDPYFAASAADGYPTPFEEV